MRINGYKSWEEYPNTICEGARVFTKTFHFETKNVDKERLVRVYIPSTYDFDNPNKRFKTIYMFDGKNLFDDYTSFVGEWGIDETIEMMIHEGVSDGYIVIGIDAPKDGYDRSMEMTPDPLTYKKRHKISEKGYASLLGKFIFDVVKPDIDSTFFTRPEKEFTGVGGSSMGGIMSFYMGLEYPDKFKYCLNFSPAHFLYTWESIEKYLDSKINLELPKQYLYVGGNGFEALFVKAAFKTYDYFLKHGWDHNQITLVYDSNKEHNEKAWREYFRSALERMDF